MNLLNFLHQKLLELRRWFFPKKNSKNEVHLLFKKVFTFSLMLLFLLFGSIKTEAQCVSTSSFNWDNGAGSGYTWLESDFSRSYTNVDGSGINVTLDLTDADNQNCDLGNPSTFGDYTETTGGFGNSVLTFQMTSTNSTQYVEYKFTFSSPVLMDEFIIYDIDYNGVFTTSNLETFQDEVAFSAANSGANVSVNLSQHPSATASVVNISGQSAAGAYVANVNGNVGNTDPNGGVVVSTSAAITEFVIRYSNGPDDDGTSDDHAISVPGFTFCEAPEDNDNDGIADINDIDDDNDGITDMQELCGTDPATPATSPINISINLDQYASEISWTLSGPSGQVASGGSYGTGNITVTDSYAATENGTYTFTIFDSYGDGMNGNTYSLSGNDFSTITTAFVSQGLTNTQISQTETFTISSASASAFTCLAADPSADSDNDGTLNYQDADFCTLNGNGVCTNMDTDGDGTIDIFDLDSDGDGCYDAEEAGHSQTMLGDNTIVSSSSDVSTNGLDNDVENNDTNTSGLNYTITETNSGTYDFQSSSVTSACTPATDTDGDGIADVDDLDDDNDGIPDTEECIQNALLNSGFEVFPSVTPQQQFSSWGATCGSGTGDYYQFDEGDVSGWETNATDGAIELWGSNHCGGDPAPTPSHEGSFHLEICANEHASLFQTIATIPGSEVSWSIWHRGRKGTDVAEVWIGATGATVFQSTMSTDNTAWVNYTGNYIVPSGQTITSFEFKSISTSNGQVAAGNFIDLFEVEICSDSDGDGILDYIDLDSDNDGIPDIVEAGGIDTNGDGQIDYPTPTDPMSMVDLDGDGLADTYDDTDTQGSTPSWIAGTPISNPDSDGDGIKDVVDLDADNDGIPDVVESGGVDTDGDGIADNFADTDGDGFNDVVDGDVGNDGTAENTANAQLLTGADTNGNGVPNSYPTDDTDGDGILDHLDLDADNDGIADVVESGGTDTDGDGIADNFADTDGDGFNDVVDGDVGNDGTSENTSNAHLLTGADTNGNGVPNSYPADDTDGDGILDHLDLDADNDGIPDVVESGGTDTDGDGIADNFADTDGDGFNDVVDGDVGNDGTSENTSNAQQVTGADTNADGKPNSVVSDDLDGDGIPNQLDIDSDNDGIVDVIEAGGMDADGNGFEDSYVDIDGDGFNDNVDGDVGNDGTTENTANSLVTTGADTNSDGEPNSYPNANTDGNGNPDFLDIDADDDGIVDNTEAQPTDSYIAPNTGATEDSDGDGLNDAYEVAGTIGTFGGAGISPENTDSMDNPDYQDTDSDNDDILDVIEGHDTDGNGTADGTSPANTGVAGGTTDADGDGLLDGFDNNIASTDPTNGSLNPESHPDAKGGTAEQDWREKDLNTTEATNDFTNTPFNTQITSSVVTNDRDAEGDTQTVNSLKIDTDGDGTPETSKPLAISTTIAGMKSDGSAETNAGTLTQNASGVYTFIPTTGFVGTVHYEYEICDDGLPQKCEFSLVEVEVLPEISTSSTNVNASPDAFTTNENVTISSTLISNDSDPEGGTFTITAGNIDTDSDGVPDAALIIETGITISGIDVDGNTVANAGTLTINADGTFVFEPTNGFTGTVVADYEITDSDSDTDLAQLVIDVVPAAANDIFAVDDSALTDAETEISANIIDNDFDPENHGFGVTGLNVDTDGDGLGDSDQSANINGTTEITVGGIDKNGNAVVNAGTFVIDFAGDYTFTPAVGFSGNVNICYTICDAEAPAACDPATLEISVLDVQRDYGDAPAVYPAAWHRAMRDSNSDEILDGSNDVWLGTKTSFEGSSSSSPAGDGDTFDDAITFGTAPGNFPTSILPSTSYSVDIIVNSTGPNTVYYGMWIDWDNNGSYEDFYNGSQVTASPAIASITINSSAIYSGETVNVRIRVDDSPLVAGDYTGGKTNGEVEDFQRFVALPVELNSFEAESEDCEIHLTWETASEIDFDYFELQRSEDGVDFRKLAIIEAEGGDFAQSYKYTDKTALKLNYYRLKIVDLDGSMEYSKVVAQQKECEESHELIIYPNPLSKRGEFLNVEFYSERPEAQIQITDMLGRVVRKITLEVEPDFQNTVQIDISDLPVGSYAIQLVGNKKAKIITIQE